MYADDLMENCLSSFFCFYESLIDDEKNTFYVSNLEKDALSNLELYEIRSSLGKQCEITLNNDIKIYKQQLIELKTEREKLIKDIVTLNNKLIKAKSERNNQEEYNIMINAINHEPQRSKTTQALNEMKLKLNEINNELNKCNKTIQRRSKQCYAAFSAVQALNRSIMQSNHNKNNDVDDDNDVSMQ